MQVCHKKLLKIRSKNSCTEANRVQIGLKCRYAQFFKIRIHLKKWRKTTNFEFLYLVSSLSAFVAGLWKRHRGGSLQSLPLCRHQDFWHKCRGWRWWSWNHFFGTQVMPSQWEFQVGPTEGIDMGDDLWVARLSQDHLRIIIESSKDHQRIIIKPLGGQVSTMSR